MPHGDFSDLGAIMLIGGGVVQIWYQGAYTPTHSRRAHLLSFFGGLSHKSAAALLWAARLSAPPLRCSALRRCTAAPLAATPSLTRSAVPLLRPRAELCFKAHGPVTPLITLAEGASPSAEVSTLLSVMGGFLIILGCMLFTVRWNTVNGKMSGLACIGCAFNLFKVFGIQADVEAIIAAQAPPSTVSVPQIAALVMLFCGLHLMFNANPLVKAASADSTKSPAKKSKKAE